MLYAIILIQGKKDTFPNSVLFVLQTFLFKHNSPVSQTRLKRPTEKFKNKIQKGYYEICNTYSVTGMQTSGKKKQEVLFPIFELSPLAYNATKIVKVNRFY